MNRMQFITISAPRMSRRATSFDRPCIILIDARIRDRDRTIPAILVVGTAVTTGPDEFMCRRDVRLWGRLSWRGQPDR